MDKEKTQKPPISKYKIGGTIYEVESSFSGNEKLSNKVMRMLRSEKIKEKRADNDK